MKLPLFIVPILIWLITQIIKILFDIIEEKKFDFAFFRRAGWFPSVHSSISSSITTLMRLKYWLDSPYFALALIFSFLFWYDAMNVRYEAWKHAQYIKEIIIQFKQNFKIKPVKSLSLKERLGHTFLEVIAWVIVWFTLTVLIYHYFIIW